LVKGGFDELVPQSNYFLLNLLLIEYCLHRTKISKHKKGRSNERPFLNDLQ
jgi:hypothetical protein